jgi:hypothetical protein
MIDEKKDQKKGTRGILKKPSHAPTGDKILDFT